MLSSNWTPTETQTCLLRGRFLSSLINSWNFTAWYFHACSCSVYTLQCYCECWECGWLHSCSKSTVTWSTTVPPQCVAAVTVEFTTSSHGSVVATYTTTSSTAVIQTGLQCSTNYYITVVVSGETSDGVRVTLRSRQVRVGGKEIVCMRFNHNVMVALSL